MADDEILHADEGTVRALCNHLLRAYEEFINQAPTPIEYVDGFMAAHNFHVQVVLDLEHRLIMKPSEQLFWRKVALDTFRKALEERP